jgi:uncharacterized membrane protein
MRTRIQRNILTGLLTVVPLAVTWFVFDFILSLLARFGSPVARWLAHLFDTSEGTWAAWLLDPWFQWSLAILLTVCGLWLLGLFTTFVVGQRIVGLIDQTLERMPVVKQVYGGTRRLIDALQVKPDQTSQRVVLIDFPLEGTKVVGLLTKTMRDKATGEELAVVYVPTTPNPTSGYLEILPMSRVVATDFTFDEAMSFIITGGAVGPEEIAFYGDGSGPPGNGGRAAAASPPSPRAAFPRGGALHRPKSRPPA